MSLRWPWKTVVICEPEGSRICKGLFLGENPLDDPTNVFMVQIFICIIFTSTMNFLLRPHGHSTFFSHMIGAIVSGPNLLGLVGQINKFVFTESSMYMFETVQYLGVIFYVFLVGMTVDIRTITRSGKRGFIIGFLHYFTASMLSTTTSFIIKKTYIIGDEQLSDMLPFVGAIQSGSAFYVIVCLLSDLKLLNSELGRLATSSSMVSGTLSAVIGWVMMLTESGLSITILFKVLSAVCMSITIVYAIRPLMLWIARQTPEGYSIKDEHMAIVLILVLICALTGQILGQHFLFGPIVLGLCIPPGPPLASSIEDKLHSFYSGILLPIHYCSVAWRASVYSVRTDSLLYVVPIILLAYLGKLAATMLPSLYLRMPFKDALSLGLIMCSQGIFDIVFIRRAYTFGTINQEVYSILIFTIVLSAGIIGPLVKAMYKPSKKFFVYKRRTIQQTRGDKDLRILACVYHQENAPGIITLIEASTPTSENPVCAHVLHLIELQGLSTPLLVSHKRDTQDSLLYNQSIHIINAFRSYEQVNRGAFSVQCFSAMSPIETMHEDICTLALNKKSSLVIIPFHRQMNSGGLVESTTPFRQVNRDVLEMAPCSVAILISRGSSYAQNLTPGSRTLYRVVMVFLGGPDDREALTYCMRMAEHSNIHLTLIELVPKEKSSRSLEGKLDDEVLYEFKITYKGKDRITYIEEVISDGMGTVTVLRALEKNSYDLVVVGRHHSRNSQLVKGLTMWNEFPELGCIGEMFVASDMSILVVQEQPRITEDLLVQGSPRYHSDAV